MRNLLQTLTDTVRTYPYLAALLGFGSALAWGLVKLAALLETLQ